MGAHVPSTSHSVPSAPLRQSQIVTEEMKSAEVLNPRSSMILDITLRMKECIAILKNSASLEELNDGDTSGFQICLPDNEHS